VPHPADAPTPEHRTVLSLEGVTVTRGSTTLVGPLDWSVGSDQRWVVLGANGSGKSTLLAVAAMRTHPSVGSVTVLGERLGTSDVRRLRQRIGYGAEGLAQQIERGLTVHDVVVTGWHAALAPWWHTYEDEAHRSAVEACGRVGLTIDQDRTFGTLSSGERQRALLARALVRRPELLLLDEPAAGLDPAGREDLVSALDRLTATSDAPPLVLVTHHLEEVPETATHALLLRDASIVASGPIEEVLTADHLSECFGLALTVGRHASTTPGAGRWWCHANPT
jgi:iron complex transport system ATP-binding protein